MPGPSPSRPLGPPQFGLRTLLLVVSTAAVLLGLSQWLSPIKFAAVLLLVLSVIDHVAGNVIGSRLRDGRQRAKPEPASEDRPQPASLRDHHFAPVTKLGGRHSLGWIPAVGAAAGLLLGAAGGGIWTAILLQPEFDWFPVSIAMVAFGALGGFGGFLVVGFCKALGEAWHEAAHQKDSE
jgi:hypothetical protein